MNMMNTDLRLPRKEEDDVYVHLLFVFSISTDGFFWKRHGHGEAGII